MIFARFRAQLGNCLKCLVGMQAEMWDNSFADVGIPDMMINEVICLVKLSGVGIDTCFSVTGFTLDSMAECIGKMRTNLAGSRGTVASSVAILFTGGNHFVTVTVDTMGRVYGICDSMQVHLWSP